MLRTISCLIFILTNSVMAQASEQTVSHGAVRFQLQKWIPTYAGETEIDGLPVKAHLEQMDADAMIPDVLAEVQMDKAFVPSLMPVVKQAFRLNFIVSDRPKVQTAYMVTPRTISIEGNVHSAFLSQEDDERGFQFLATEDRDGSVSVVYTRKVSGGREPIRGEFKLFPVPHILN